MLNVRTFFKISNYFIFIVFSFSNYRQKFMQSASSNQAQKQSRAKTNSQLIDINLTFGDDGGQETLAQINFNFFSVVSTKIDEEREKFLKEIQSKQQDKNDSLLVFKFEVQTGRQRQSFEFIEKGLDQDDNNQNTSEMQKLFHRPKTTGRIQMKQGKGFIYVIYRFYHEKIQTSDFQSLDQLIEAKFDLDFSIDAIIKGKTEPSKRSFTSIKSDFVNLRLQSQKITMRDFLNFLQQKGEFDSNITESDFYKLIRNMQVAKFDLKFNSVRRVLGYYNRIMNSFGGIEDIEYKKRVAPLSSKGIFKNYASVNFYLGTKLGFRGELTYKTEEIMMRLVARCVEMTEDL